MPSLEMSLGLRIRSKVNWLQNDKLLLCNLLTIIFMMTIKFTETIHDVLKIHVAFNTQPRQKLSICQCKVKGLYIARSKYAMFMLHFLSVSYQSNNVKLKKTVCEWFRSKFKQCIVILKVQLQVWSGLKVSLVHGLSINFMENSLFFKNQHTQHIH